MADEKPKMVTVEALEWHTYDGKDYDVGDTYDIDEQYVDSVAFQGKAVRTDRVAEAKKAARAAEVMTESTRSRTPRKARAVKTTKPRKTRK